MRTNLFQRAIIFLLTAFSCGAGYAQEKKTLVVKTNAPGAAIQPTMWGVFFEDINMGADGGIYAELIKNRSFEFFKPLMGWKLEQKPFVEGTATILNRLETNKSNPRFLRIKLNNTQPGGFGLINEGFRGMGLKKDLRYDFSYMYRTNADGIKIHIDLLNAKNEVIGTAVTTPPSSADWRTVTTSLNASATELKGQCRIWFEGTGEVDLDMISLFPGDTWKGRPGGLRSDMVQLLADMKPGFIRFPGGCIVEGFDLSQRYQWKKTIGPVDQRQLIINRWNYEFAHRPAPDYFQSFGLGFFEYFQLAADIGAEPLPILNCGMACQFNSAELVPMDQLDSYVQDALDLVEFANGDINTTWGKIRAAMGHPAPFNLKMIGVGNENWGPQYLERLQVFQQAIKARYPNIRIIASSGTDPDGARFDLLNAALRKINIDFIDEHYYRRPEWFLQNVSRYDSYPRNNTKVFAGEWAAQSERTGSAGNKNNWQTALAEAAFMTGLERNADVVEMASYAPLFAHVDGWQWAPDLIWVNNLRAYGTPDYYVQKLFSTNRGSTVLPITLDNEALAGKDSLFASASRDGVSNELILKLVNVSGKAQAFSIRLDGVKKINSQARLISMQGTNPGAMNSFDQPFQVSPKEETLKVRGKKFDFVAAAGSVNVLRIRML